MKKAENSGKKKKQEHSEIDMPPKRTFRVTLVTKLCIVLAVLSCLVYANTLRNGFVMDDVMVIAENHYVKQGFAGIPTLLTTHHLEGFGSNEVSDYYRPFSLVVFAVEYEIFGLNPLPGHFFNIIYFAACVVLLFLFLNKLFNGERVVTAFVAALLFAVLPVHTEVVANIKSRDELLCFVFAFTAMLIFMNYVRQGKTLQLIAGTFCLFLAVLSKETVLTFIGVIPLVFFFYKSENKKRSLWITGSIAAITVVFLFLWNYVQTRSEVQESLVAKVLHSLSKSSGEAPLTLAPKILILGYHLKTMLLGYPLNFNYSINSFAWATFKNAWVVISAVLYLFILLAGIVRLLRDRKDPWAFGMLFYIITISLYSNMVFILGQVMADRYEFFPSVGFCVVFALAFERWILRAGSNDISALKSARSLAVLVPILLCYATMTVARNTDWTDNFTLVNADIHKSPADYTMEYKAGLELQNKYDSEPDSLTRKKLNDESIMHFLRSIEINPDYTESHSDVGVAYFKVNNYDSAEYHFRYALKLNSRHVNAATNMGTLFFKKMQYRDAIEYYQKTVRLDSNVDVAWYNMGICYARLRQVDSSLLCIKKVIKIAPAFDDYKSYLNAAILYNIKGDVDSARKYEQITKKYYPDFHL